MDIMELGAIGELVGGVAVIGSLIYVGLQVRQGTLATRSANQRSSMSAWAAITTPLHSNAELSALFARALDDAEPLNRDERIRVHYLLSHMVNFLADQHDAWRAGILDEPTMRAWEGFIASVVAKPGGRSWWDSAGRLWPEHVRTRLTQAVEVADPYDDLPFLRPEPEGL